MAKSEKLRTALRLYRQRLQFNDAVLLQKVMDAVREEERANFSKLYEAALAIVEAGRGY